MIPAHAATQKTRRPAMCEVVQGVGRPPLADHERDPGGEGDDREAGDEGSLVRHGREVDPEDQRADEQRRQDAAEVVDRIGPLVHVRRDETHGQDQRHDRERQRDQEDRPPPEVLEQQAREHRPERRDGTPDPRPQGDRPGPLGAGPQRGDQRQGRRERHPRGQPAAEPGDEQHRRRSGRRRRAARSGIANAVPRISIQLAPVPVADRAEPQHRGREPERVAHGDEVQRRLGRVERRPDRRQGDVGDREVQVGDRRDQDQGGEHEPRTRGSPRRCPGRAAVPEPCSLIRPDPPPRYPRILTHPHAGRIVRNG